MSEKRIAPPPETSHQPVILFRIDIYHRAIAQELTSVSQTIPVDPPFHLDDYEAHDPHFDNDLNA